MGYTVPYLVVVECKGFIFAVADGAEGILMARVV